MVMYLEHKIAMLRCVRILSTLLVFIIGSSFAHSAEIEAKLDRESVAAGNGALLMLTISGGRAERPEIPVVKDLIVQPRNQSQRMQIGNGITSVSIDYDWIIGSNTPGDYLIPQFEVTVDGKKYSTQPLKLKVLASGAAQPPAGLPQGGVNPQPVPPSEDDTSEKRFGFLTVELADNERKNVYVGEIAPVRIRAWLPMDARAQLRSGVQPEGKAFTLHNVSGQPQQTQEIKDGKRYLAVTWFGGISATKAGKYPVSLSLDATVAVRDNSAQMIQKDVTLQSEDQPIEVLPLPTEGKPSNFTGAVGKFKFDGSEVPSNWNAGEPQQIIARLSGSGNFTLLNAPEVTPSDAWKSYPAKGEFTSGDQASFSGSKTFRFSAMPKKGGNQEAALAFSYFDPEAGQYQTLTSPPKPISVAGKDMVEDEPATPTEPEKKIEKKPSGLIGLHAKRSPAATLIPLVNRPSFVKLLEISIFLCLFGPLFSWIFARRNNPKRLALAAMERATREALDQAGKCVAARDVSGFFSAARLAIQQRLGALWNQAPQAITSAEVEARIPVDSPVVRFFREADSYEYSLQTAGEILPQWRALLDEALASLTPSTR